ncbi:hypothetical protein [Streptomyces sp. V1I6]|uniref:hypothetical protein n=1 Tax=Streptomyces sp. V1I6 TaxID=3042273 RepID=UPI0027D91E29|nr:hypothetical protein [Streptomyces sp. V1I6]
MGAGWLPVGAADGFSVPADADGAADGPFADVDAGGREGFAAASSSCALSGPHAHTASTTQADTAALTIVRVFIRSPPPADYTIKASRRIRGNGS